MILKSNITTLTKATVSLVVPLTVGAVAGLGTSSAISTWYAQLNQPFFNPPNWIFGPVWTTLYVLMGISLFLIWRQAATKERDNAMLIFAIQLTLNFAWSFLFFYFKRIDLALVEIIILWIFIFLMIRRFYAINKPAGLMNIPYLAWVSFATLLNAAYLVLN